METNTDYKDLYENATFLMTHFKQVVSTLTDEVKSLKSVIEDQKTEILALKIQNNYRRPNINEQITGQNLFP